MPAGARPLTTEGPGRFVTRAVYEIDGIEREWASRTSRKRGRLGATGVPGWCTRSWWIAVLFMVGSACFAIGAVPGYASLVGAAATGVTYFVGSIFFTSAGYLQYLEVVNTPAGPGRGRSRLRLASWEPRRIDWLATAIQLVGTVFFNISTLRAMIDSFDAEPETLLSWRPDALGSVCFLVASWLAYAEAGHGWLSWRPDDLGWRIAALNLAGSIFFGFSAIGAYVVPSTDELVSAALANAGTLLGAIGFFVGAALLLPEAMKPPAAPTARRIGLTASHTRRMR